MSYSTNPNLEKARGKAMKLLFIDELSVQIVADRFGVSRTTIWRWKRKWLALNSHIALENQVRQKDKPISSFRLSACSWRIPTNSGRVHWFILFRKRIVRCAQYAHLQLP